MKTPTWVGKTLIPALLICGLSAQGQIIPYSVSFAPVPGGSGTGIGTVDYDSANHLLTLNATWSGLSGNTTLSHIHLPTATPFAGSAGVVLTPGTLPDFPVGVASGSYLRTLDLTSAATYPAAFVTANGGVAGAEAAVIAAFDQGRAYWNIHTGTFPGGEINGFLVLVPEPSSMALAGLGIAAIVARSWSRRPGVHRSS